MSRILAVLLLSFVALVARADAPHATLAAEVAYLGDPLDLVTTFQLVHQGTGEVLWSSRNVQARPEAGILKLEVVLPDGDWQPSREVRWCLSVDARRAEQPVQIQAVSLNTPGTTYGNIRPGRDFQGESSRACIRGATHSGLE